MRALACVTLGFSNCQHQIFVPSGNFLSCCASVYVDFPTQFHAPCASHLAAFKFSMCTALTHSVPTVCMIVGGCSQRASGNLTQQADGMVLLLSLCSQSARLAIECEEKKDRQQWSREASCKAIISFGGDWIDAANKMSQIQVCNACWRRERERDDEISRRPHCSILVFSQTWAFLG